MLIVITINYNLCKETIACVQSVLNSTYSNKKVFLIDNGSKDEDFQQLKSAFENNSEVSIFRIDKNVGYVGGVNFGLNKSIELDPDFILIMNNDTIIAFDAIDHLVEASFRYNNNAIISGKVYYFDQPDILQHTGVVFTDYRFLKTSYPGHNEKDIGQCDVETERDSLDDVFWLLPARVVKEVGYYSPYFFLYAEQGDYAQRARRKGFKLIYTPGAKLWHKESMTTGGGNSKALPIYYWRGQGLFIFQYRNLKKKYFFLFMCKSFIIYITKAFFFSGDSKKQYRALLRGYFYGFFWMFNKKPNSGYNPYLN